MIGQKINIEGRGIGLYLGDEELGERFIGRLGQNHIFEIFIGLDSFHYGCDRHVFDGPYWEFGYIEGINKKYEELDEILKERGI